MHVVAKLSGSSVMETMNACSMHGNSREKLAERRERLGLGKHSTRGNIYHCDLWLGRLLVICVWGNTDP